MTIWREIASDLRGRIIDGTYPPGSKIPALPQLMAEYSAARDTVRDAVQRLANEGLVTPLRGVGTVVRDVTPVDLAYAPGRTSPIWQGRDVLQRVHIVDPDPDIRELLQVPQGTPVVNRLRHQTRGSQVAQLHEQWIPESLIIAIRDVTGNVDLSDMDCEPDTDLFTLLELAGHRPSTVTERVYTRMPDPDEREVLELPPGIPVLMTRRVSSSSVGPVETSLMTGAGDRMSLSYTVDR